MKKRIYNAPELQVLEMASSGAAILSGSNTETDTNGILDPMSGVIDDFDWEEI